MMKTQASVIVPMHNASGHIEDCLSGISKQGVKDFEVILVDDGSMDDTVQKAAKFPFKIVELKGPGSPARARNYGTREASGDIFIFVDADTVLEPDSIEKIIALISKADTDAVSGVYAQDSPQAGFFSQLQNLIPIYRLSKLPQIINFTNSAFCAIKKGAFEAIGGYNEKMSYYEDVEIGHRLTQKGFRCRLNTELKVTHLKRFNHLGLLRDYFKKTVAAARYGRDNFAKKLERDNIPLDMRIAGVSTGLILLSLGFIKITVIPLLLFLGIYSISIVPLLSFLTKSRNLYFGLKSYVVCFEILLVSQLALIYGILTGNSNG